MSCSTVCRILTRSSFRSSTDSHLHQGSLYLEGNSMELGKGMEGGEDGSSQVSLKGHIKMSHNATNNESTWYETQGFTSHQHLHMVKTCPAHGSLQQVVQVMLSNCVGLVSVTRMLYVGSYPKQFALGLPCLAIWLFNRYWAPLEWLLIDYCWFLSLIIEW